MINLSQFASLVCLIKTKILLSKNQFRMLSAVGVKMYWASVINYVHHIKYVQIIAHDTYFQHPIQLSMLASNTSQPTDQCFCVYLCMYVGRLSTNFTNIITFDPITLCLHYYHYTILYTIVLVYGWNNCYMNQHIYAHISKIPWTAMYIGLDWRCAHSTETVYTKERKNKINFLYSAGIKCFFVSFIFVV